MSEIDPIAQDLPGEEYLNGVDGWLAVYILTGAVGFTTNCYSLIHPAFHGILPVRWAVVLFGAVTILLVCFRNRWALPAVAAHLVINSVMRLYWFVIFFMPAKDGLAFVPLVTGLAVNIAWYLYFKRSRRVRYTLGRNLP